MQVYTSKGKSLQWRHMSGFVTQITGDSPVQLCNSLFRMEQKSYIYSGITDRSNLNF